MQKRIDRCFVALSSPQIIKEKEEKRKGEGKKDTCFWHTWPSWAPAHPTYLLKGSNLLVNL